MENHPKNASTEPHRLTVPIDAGGTRLDIFLAHEIGKLSRTRLQKLIRQQNVRCNDQLIIDPAYRLRSGDRLSLMVPEAEEHLALPQPLPLSILFEDEHLVVLEKPAGLVVHPAPGHPRGTLVNALIAHCGDSLSGIGGVRRPGIVHRLDKDVSGVMVIAKNNGTHIGLAAQFSVHSVDRVYEALVWGLPRQTSGTIEGAIGRHPNDRKRMAVVPRGGKVAKTHYRVITSAGTRVSRLEFILDTGRTHQIRVHSLFNGHAIIGDPIYRQKRQPPMSIEALNLLQKFQRIALHAKLLGFLHPATGHRLRFERPAPSSFDQLFACFAA
ncbi:MAG: RluA family pseudouridine synthase [Pseudomonadota bacterium]